MDIIAMVSDGYFSSHGTILTGPIISHPIEVVIGINQFLNVCVESEDSLDVDIQTSPELSVLIDDPISTGIKETSIGVNL
jgi:hypothetical protein